MFSQREYIKVLNDQEKAVLSRDYATNVGICFSKLGLDKLECSLQLIFKIIQYILRKSKPFTSLERELF